MITTKVMYACNGANICSKSAGCVFTNPEGYVCSHTKIPEFLKNPEYAKAMEIVLNNFDISVVGIENATVVFSEKIS